MTLAYPLKYMNKQTYVCIAYSMEKMSLCTYVILEVIKIIECSRPAPGIFKGYSNNNDPRVHDVRLSFVEFPSK